ncbi:MAG TPA: hypothetical protein VJ738_08895 [Steroidobacteraceae bacterium]|nr:hypothetical protein [Steroidobacteraceae bacterium]
MKPWTNNALRSGTALYALAAFFLACVGSVTPATAAVAGAPITVSAVVQPRTAIVSATMPASLDVTASDVARGFVEVSGSSQILVTNNSPEGFELEVLTGASVFSSVAVQGLGAEATVEAEGGEIFLPSRRGAAIPLILSYRFQLASGTTPGRYPWPLQFGVRPISPNGG